MAKPFIQCKAKSKQTGERCKRRVTPGREVCYYHGGRSLRGVAHPSFKTGRHSKHLPVKLGELYEEALESAALTSLRDDLALVDARVKELLEGLGSGESEKAWDELHEAYETFLAARNAGDAPRMATQLERIGLIIERGRDEQEVWDQITRLLTSRRQMIDTEGKNAAREQTVITAEKALVLVAALVDVVNRHVRDRKVLSQIHDEVDHILLPSIGISE